ncbi:MAG TPA: 3-hydroxyacyl-CoA dehydrogenase NAD-binding domain-containing protein [Candidatus Acidoferrum sp.]|jgi:3-hydroxybutyryl-CoA dehydrogenase|nr:3-hydroxyacyl-CoA dehydrogenase NAD-binding domain-containing protein [Candidatus Acidoferrum sp.]
MNPDIKTIAVIGAGTMGRGIAYAAAFGGYSTVLEDISPQMLHESMRWITKSFDEGVARRKVDAQIRDHALSLIATAGSVEVAIRDADLIIEAVPEEMEMKMELFTIFDKFAKPDAIFASNTSSLSISDMSDLTVSRERCIGMHFFNPVPKMKLIELVKTQRTSQNTVDACTEVGRRMGKEVVLVQESPGFITTRVIALIGNEAFAMLEAGIASAEDIDKALKLGLNHPMGPFELVDLVGLDVRLNILEYLHQTLGEKYRPNRLLKQYVQEGRLGRKSGRGVYDYSKGVTASKTT